MTIIEACAILNERRHDDCDDWQAQFDAAPANTRKVFEYEAIAVAEKYVREAPQTEPMIPIVDRRDPLRPKVIGHTHSPTKQALLDLANGKARLAAEGLEDRDGQLRISGVSVVALPE